VAKIPSNPTKQVVFNGIKYDFWYAGAMPEADKKYGILSPIMPIGHHEYGKAARFFFLWRCDCGKIKSYPVKEVLSGKSKSCGCLSYNLNPSGWTKSRNPPMSSWKTLYNRYKQSATHRRLNFNISLEFFISMASCNCSFCGDGLRVFNKWNESSARAKAKHITADEMKKYEITVSGIDRINSSLGYTEENCQPCCKDCNRAKMDLSEQEFLCLVKKIYMKRIKDLQPVAHC
jgi:hypothetical protein